MTDERFVFQQTNRERAAAGRGDRCKKRQGGKYVRLPSDNLTEKEKRAMNGEVKTYNVQRCNRLGYSAAPGDRQKRSSSSGRLWLAKMGGGADAMERIEAANLPAQEEKRAEAAKNADKEVYAKSRRYHGGLKLCGEAAAVLQKAFELIGSGEYEINVEWWPL